MACSINKTKHLYWCMMLAMIVVLIWVLNGPKIMVKMIVAGSSATQHTSSEKRQLRSSSYMTAKINGGEEERMNFDLVLPDLNLPALSKDMTKAMKIGEEHVATMLTADENAKRVEIADLLKWAKELKQSNPKEYVKAASAKLIELITKKGEEVISTSAAAKNVLLSEKAAEDLAKILGSPLLYICVFVYPKEVPKFLLPRLFDVLLSKFGEKAVAEQLFVAQSNDATRIMAGIFTQYQMLRWQNFNYSSEKVWKHLGLDKAGIQMFDSPLLKMWITHLGRSKEDSSDILLSMLRKKFENDDLLSKWFADAPKDVHTDEGMKGVAYLNALLKKKTIIKESTTLATKRHQRNVDEASASRKRQRVSG